MNCQATLAREYAERRLERVRSEIDALQREADALVAPPPRSPGPWLAFRAPQPAEQWVACSVCHALARGTLDDAAIRHREHCPRRQEQPA